MATKPMSIPKEVQSKIEATLPKTCTNLSKGIPAVKLFWSRDFSKWEDPGVIGGATFVIDREKKTKLIRIYDVSTMDVLFETETAFDVFLEPMTDTVYAYELPDSMVAFNFLDEAEALRFCGKVNSSVPRAQSTLGKPTEVKHRRKRSFIQKVSGFFRRKSRDARDIEADVGQVYAVQHTGTISVDDEGKLNTNVPPEFEEYLKPVLKNLNVSKSEFRRDPVLRSRIIDAATNNLDELKKLSASTRKGLDVTGGKKASKAPGTIDHQVVTPDDEASSDSSDDTDEGSAVAPSQSQDAPTGLPPPPGPPTTTASAGLPPPPGPAAGGAGLPAPPTGLPAPPKDLAPPPAPKDIPPAAAAPARADLMSAIRGGVPLKKSKKKKRPMSEAKEAEPHAGGGLYSQLFSIVSNRRKSLMGRGIELEASDSDSSDWSDSD